MTAAFISSFFLFFSGEEGLTGTEHMLADPKKCVGCMTSALTIDLTGEPSKKRFNGRMSGCL